MLFDIFFCSRAPGTAGNGHCGGGPLGGGVAFIVATIEVRRRRPTLSPTFGDDGDLGTSDDASGDF